MTATKGAQVHRPRHVGLCRELGGLWLLAGLLDNLSLFYAGIIATLAVAIFTLVC